MTQIVFLLAEIVGRATTQSTEGANAFLLVAMRSVPTVRATPLKASGAVALRGAILGQSDLGG